MSNKKSAEAAEISTSSNVEIVYAVLHNQIFYPAIGPLGPTLTRDGGPTNKPVDMTLEGNLVRLRVKDKVSKPVDVLVPVTNFTHLVPAK